MKYTAIKTASGGKFKEALVLVEDGGVATLHHNDNYIIGTFYVDRADEISEDMFDKLAEGKVYLHDFMDKQEVDDDAIMECLNWLMVPSPDEVWEYIRPSDFITQFNKSK